MPAERYDVNIEVGGVVVPPENVHRYVFRFTFGGEPALYDGGRRMVQPWKVKMDVSVPADAHGENANTA